MTSNSKPHHQAGDRDDSEAPQTRWRFGPEPIESATKSARKKEAGAPEDYQSQQTGKLFVPDPVETTVRRRRKQRTEEDPDPPLSYKQTASQSSNGMSGARKFSPELIETARGSFKRGEGSPKASCSQTTAHPTAVPQYLRPPLAPRNSPCHSSEEVPQIHESRYSAASLAKRQTRQHSFLVPELPCIESDSSDENSVVPSLSTSPSVSSEESSHEQRMEGIQEVHDSGLQGYMLSLAAQAAEKQLREQAMAAYPNEHVHEPVHHFAAEDSDGESFAGSLKADNGVDPRTFRRESGLDWHMKEMRRHHAQLEEAKKALKEDTAGQSRFSAGALLARHKMHATKVVGKPQKEVGLAEMRSAASPPMLGDDLVFSLSVSPKMTRCDVDQIPVPRTDGHVESKNETGEAKLWSANVGVQNSPGVGLWMGLCQRKEGNGRSPPTPVRSGLRTPAVDADYANREAGLQHGRALIPQGHNLLPPPASPGSSHNDLFTASVDLKLNKELGVDQQIQQEFHNGFVTQIYNYLSLGYPSLAHKFDDELSKISRIPVHELRKDDDRADAKGYVGAPEGEGLDEDSVKSGKCARWTALRLYIHEWARQQPGMADAPPDDWGVRARRGSWAF